jgi:hypothetical protein
LISAVYAASRTSRASLGVRGAAVRWAAVGGFVCLRLDILGEHEV